MVEKPWLVTSVETFNISSTQLLGQFQFIYHKKIFLNTTIPLADFKYGVNTDVNIGVSVSRGGNTLFEVMGIC